MNKWYVTDMDGTFLMSNNQLHEQAVKVVKEMTARELPFYIATGRLDLMIRSYYNDLGLTVPVISCNGALIRNLSTNEIIDSTHFSYDEIASIVKIIKEANLDYHIYTPQAVYGERHTGRIAYLTEFEANYPTNLQTPVVVTDNVLESIMSKSDLPLKVLIIEQDRAKVLQVYHQLTNLLKIEGTFSGPGLFDIMKEGISKGAALKKLAKYYNYQLENCVAFGDNDNDLSMLKLAGTAVVPNNAHDNIKLIANEVILSNDEGGVVQYLKNELLV